jgi:hypothetical protein
MLHGVIERVGAGKARPYIPQEFASEVKNGRLLERGNPLGPQRGKRYAIATIRPDGYPQATTVSYVSDGLTIYFGCVAESQKAQNIAYNNKVSLTVTLPISAGRGSAACPWVVRRSQ